MLLDAITSRTALARVFKTRVRNARLVDGACGEVEKQRRCFWHRFDPGGSLLGLRNINVLQWDASRRSALYAVVLKVSDRIRRIEANDTPDFRYRMNGFYDANLKPYYDMFPREQIRVYLFEEWNADPAGTLRSIFRFLDVDEDAQIGVERRNVTHRYRSQRLHRFLARPGRFGKRLHRVLPAALRSRLDRWNQMQPPPMPPELWRELTEGYREDILNLQARIGRDLSHWLKNDRPGAARG